MRKIIPLLITTAALVAASPAAADNLASTTTQSQDANSLTATCTSPYAVGVKGQFGADGYFVDGCSTGVVCQADSCDVTTVSSIEDESRDGIRVTQNSRIRRFDTSGNKIDHRDASCDGLDSCEIRDTATVTRGQSASVQCNGTRRTGDDNRSQNVCQITLAWASADCGCGDPAGDGAPAGTTPSKGGTPPPSGTAPKGGAGAYYGGSFEDDDDFPLPPGKFTGGSSGTKSSGSYANGGDDAAGVQMLLGFRGLKGRKAVVQVTCPPEAEQCQGRVAVRLGAKTMKTAPFAPLAGGTSKVLRLKLSKAKKRKVLAAGAVQVVATATDGMGTPPQTSQRSFQL
jgi:hypothetical protein